MIQSLNRSRQQSQSPSRFTWSRRSPKLWSRLLLIRRRFSLRLLIRQFSSTQRRNDEVAKDRFESTSQSSWGSIILCFFPLACLYSFHSPTIYFFHFFFFSLSFFFPPGREAAPNVVSGLSWRSAVSSFIGVCLKSLLQLPGMDLVL